jgi:hypothetical protein
VEDEDENRAMPFILQTYCKMYCSVARISLQHVGFSATEWIVYHALKLPLRIAWCDKNSIFPSWYVCLLCEEGT